MASKLKAALFCSALLLALPACQKNSPGDDNGMVEFDDGSDYAEQSACQFTADDGGPALDSLAHKQKIQTTFFGKRFNRSHLDALMGASARETARYVSTYEDAQIYHIKSHASSCRIYDFLPRVNAELSQVWRSAAVSGLVGLYLPRGYKLGDQLVMTTANAGAILVRDVGTRWTLVHESMHHLFHTQTIADGQADDEVLKKLWLNSGNQLKDLAGRFEASPSDEQLFSSLVTELSKYHGYLYQILVRFPLEEMTIERTLIERYQSARFSYVPDRTLNSRHYIINSSSDAQSELQKVYSFASRLLRIASQSSSDMMKQNKASLDELRSTIRSEAMDIQNIESIARDSVGPHSIETHAADVDSEELEQPCQHEQEFKELMKQVPQLFCIKGRHPCPKKLI